MKIAVKTAILFLAIVVLSSSNGISLLQARQSSLISRVIEELQREIPKWIEAQDIPGAAVAVVDDKNVLWEYVYGRTRREGGRRIDPETLFSIQSMSKSFTALGVLMAVQDGLLNLDTPIPEYLPEFKVNSPHEESPERKMTLRHLLAHRAGFTHEAPLGGNYDDRPHAFDEHILSISDTWLRYPVGSRYSYSNLGIDLAGYILQEQAGMPFWDYIRIKVLEPLGMDQSTLDVDKIKETANRAIGHVASRHEIEGGIPVFIPMIPAGGVYTNIRDMAKYLQFHINKGTVEGRQLLRGALVEEMHSVAFSEKQQQTGYGLGISRHTTDKTYYLQHGGGGYGFITSMCMYPELKIGVVTLTNSEGSKISSASIVNIINSFVESQTGKIESMPAVPSKDIMQPLDETDERTARMLGVLEAGIHSDRYYGTYRSCDFQKPEKSQNSEGPDKPEWKKYIGRYQMLVWGRWPASLLWVTKVKGYLVVNGSRCTEYLPGLFFTQTGEALDFRGTIPTFRNILLYKKK